MHTYLQSNTTSQPESHRNNYTAASVEGMSDGDYSEKETEYFIQTITEIILKHRSQISSGSCRELRVFTECVIIDNQKTIKCEIYD